MPAQSHITLRELRDLLAVQPPPIDIPPSDARPGDLVAIKDLAGSRFVSIQDGVLVVRADLNAEVRKPVPIKSDSVVAIRHRIAEGDFVIVESLATPRLGRIERIEQTGPNGPAYVVRTFLEGRRWADARMRFGADSLWPVPTEAASGLLAKMGLPRFQSHATSRLLPAVQSHRSRRRRPSRSRRCRRCHQASSPMCSPGSRSPDHSAATSRWRWTPSTKHEQVGGAARIWSCLPGAGKTLIGLEIARRLGNRCLVLGPNTAIQEQWLKQWRAYEPAVVNAGDSPDLAAPITALTYQAICDLDSHNPVLEQQIAEWQ